MPNPTREEIDARVGQHPVEAALLKLGYGADELAQQLVEELGAEETKIIKVDGNVPKPPKGTRIIGKVKRGKFVVQTILAVNMRSWRTQQRARQDAHKLCGHYPDGQNVPEGTQAVRVVLNIGTSRGESDG